MKNIVLLFVILFQFSSYSDPVVDTLGQNFSAHLPSSWSYQVGDWEYFDVIKCFTQGPTCFGNNPTSPYGFPVFRKDVNGDGLLDFKIRKNDALVIFFRAPPKMRYFGFTQYLFMRQPAATPVFASLSDTINNTTIKALDGSRGQKIFDKHSVLVWTPDLNTYSQIVFELAKQGIAEENINFLPMPIELPLNLGDSDAADTFSMLMRTAMPDVQANFDAYKSESPFYVVKVGPVEAQVVNPAAIIGYKSEETGVSESLSYQDNLNALVSDIERNYFNSFSLKAQTVSFTEKLGWDCIAGKSNCKGDNHDARYSSDISRPFKPANLKDAVLVVGVNHQKTGKALYQNHSVYDTVKLAGIVSVNDESLTTASALYHAGFSALNETKRLQYKNLYAYFISYDCTGLKHCLSIPGPTESNPVGLNPGEPFIVVGRSYADPISGVRPSTNEIVKHQSFLALKK